MSQFRSLANIVLIFAAAFSVALGTATWADEPADKAGANDQNSEPQVVELANGKLKLPASAGWERVQPKVRIIEAELSVPAAEGDEQPGRITIMSAGGSVRANIDRWIGQFKGVDKDAIQERELEVAKLKVHLVDISGTFMDRRGPFGPATERPDYRMLGAIIQARPLGNYFVKFYGPQATVEANAEAFEQMINGLEVPSLP